MIFYQPYVFILISEISKANAEMLTNNCKFRIFIINLTHSKIVPHHFAKKDLEVLNAGNL